MEGRLVRELVHHVVAHLFDQPGYEMGRRWRMFRLTDLDGTWSKVARVRGQALKGDTVQVEDYGRS